MSNKHEDILLHPACLKEAGQSSIKACEIARLFLDNSALTHLRFWPEQFDRICLALKKHGYRSDGFRVGHLKAVRYQEGK